MSSNDTATVGEGEESADALVDAGFDRHAVEVALASAKGNVDQAAALLLSWGGADPPPFAEELPAPPRSGDESTALRLRAVQDVDQSSRSSVPPLPAAGGDIPSSRRTEADERQRVLVARREQEAREIRKLRGEAKRRREQELAMWREQREDAKMRKGPPGGSNSKLSGSAVGRSAIGATGQKKAEGNAKATLQMRMPDGETVTNAFEASTTLREVVAWLHNHEPTSAKLQSKEIELRCPFPPPGLLVSGGDLDKTTIDSAGLAPRGRVMIQICGTAGIQQGAGAMPSAAISGRTHGRSSGSRFHGVGRGRHGANSAHPGRHQGRGRGLAGRGIDGNIEGTPFGEDVASVPANAGIGDGADVAGAGFDAGEDIIGNGLGVGDAGEEDAFIPWDGMAVHQDDVEEADGEQAEDGMMDEAVARGYVLGGSDAERAGAGLLEPLRPAVGARGRDSGMEDMSNVGEDAGVGGAAGGGIDGRREEGRASSACQIASVRAQRLARLDREAGGSESTAKDQARGQHKPSLDSRETVGSLQDLLIDKIVERLRNGGHLGSYGCLDGGTGARIIQRLVACRAISANILAAFRGCPVAVLSLDKNPRTTNALMAEVGRKVSLTSLTLAYCDAVTVQGIEYLTGLRSLLKLDISGCKVTNCWLKAVAKLPALETLIVRNCLKVADVGIMSLSRGARALTSLDISGCQTVTDAGVSYLSPRAMPKLVELYMGSLPFLSDDGLDAFCSHGRIYSESDLPRAPLSALRCLTVSYCGRITEKGIRRIAESFTSVKELNLFGTAVTEEGIVALGEGDERGDRMHLEKLVLPMHGRGINARGLEAVTGMTALKTLDLEACSGAGVTSDALAGISKLVNLKSISVAMVPAFDDNALAAVCSSCCLLEFVNLNGSGVASLTGLELLGSSVKELALAHTSVDDDAMDAVASLPSLTTMTLRGTNVTGSGIARLSGLKNLRSLNLAGSKASREGSVDRPGGFAVEALMHSTAALNIHL